MAASGDILRFVDGSEFRITKAAADTNGGYLEMEWSLPPVQGGSRTLLRGLVGRGSRAAAPAPAFA